MYNDSGAAEKAWDNLYDRNETIQPKDCGTCGGEGKEYYSSCCGAKVVHNLCLDCAKDCETEYEKCDVCKGEGVLHND